MQKPLDMHLGKCLYIYRMLFTKKSGIWNNLEFLRRPKMSQNGEQLCNHGEEGFT